MEEDERVSVAVEKSSGCHDSWVNSIGALGVVANGKCSVRTFLQVGSESCKHHFRQQKNTIDNRIAFHWGYVTPPTSI